LCSPMSARSMPTLLIIYTSLLIISGSAVTSRHLSPTLVSHSGAISLIPQFPKSGLSGAGRQSILRGSLKLPSYFFTSPEPVGSILHRGEALNLWLALDSPPSSSPRRSSYIFTISITCIITIPHSKTSYYAGNNQVASFHAPDESGKHIYTLCLSLFFSILFLFLQDR
jgi:hypothetical protein